MKRLIATLASLALSGCVMQCIDAGIKRQPVLIPGRHPVELRIANSEPIRKTISCEKYYDSMCAERGNYWAIREVGTDNRGSPSRISTEVENIGKVEIQMPACANLVNGELSSLNMPTIYIDGSPYFYAGTDGASHVYKQLGVKKTEPEKSVRINFDLFIDGQAVGIKKSNQSLNKDAPKDGAPVSQFVGHK